MHNATLRRVRVTIFCHEKAINIAYSEPVFVVVLIQHAKRMPTYFIAIPCLSGSTMLFHINS